MNTTGMFTIHNVHIKVDKIGEPIYLVPFGDVHRSSPMHCEEKWKEFLDWAKNKKRCYFIGMGDYDDLASASERMMLNNRSLHESTTDTLGKLYKSYTERLAKELKFMNGKLIGLLEGNHYGEFPNNTTTTQLLCDKLDTKYLGCSSFIRLSFNMQGRKTSLDIWAHHGQGKARLVGGSLNRVQQMGESAEADIYLMGHDHKKSAGLANKLKLGNGSGSLKLHHKKQLYIRTGSFLKGYEDGRISYVADMALNPTDLGVVKIEMTPKRKRVNKEDEFYIDLHASI